MQIADDSTCVLNTSVFRCFHHGNAKSPAVWAGKTITALRIPSFLPKAEGMPDRNRS
jgi:hypothetical protein